MKPQLYAIRWLTTLFSREFELKDTCRVWDSIFADPERFFFAQCIGTAMVKRIEPALLKGDFVQDIQLLQNYEMPPAEEILELQEKANKKKSEEEEKNNQQTNASLS